MKKENKKILLISRQGGLGGTERRMTDLSNFLSKKQFDVQLHFSTTSNTKGILAKFKNSPIGRFLRIIKLLLRFRPHIINAFDLETGIYVFIARNIIRSKAILISGYGAESITDRRTQGILRKNMCLADYYICNSTKASENLKSYIGDNRVITTIHNGLNAERLELTIPEEEKIAEICKGKFVIGYIGKLDNIKHGERIFSLATKMLQKDKSYNKPLHFIIIGDGPNRESVVEKLKNCPESIKNAITITGPIKDAGALAKYFKIGLLCSDSEGFPNVLLEYMYFGVVWVSTNVGDIQAILKHGATGIVVNKYEDESFEEKCNYLLNHIEEYEKFSTLGKKVFVENYSIEKMGDSYLRIYKSLLN